MQLGGDPVVQLIDLVAGDGGGLSPPRSRFLVRCGAALKTSAGCVYRTGKVIKVNVEIGSGIGEVFWILCTGVSLADIGYTTLWGRPPVLREIVPASKRFGTVSFNPESVP